MSYENISQISIPALSICVDKLFLLKPKYLTQLGIKQSERVSVENSNKVLQLLANMTIKEQFNAIFGKEYVFLNTCSIMTPKAFNGTQRYIYCEDITPIKTFINFYSMCFTLFSQTEGQSDDRYIIDFSQQKFEDFSANMMFSILNRNISKLYVFFHSRKEYLLKSNSKYDGISWSPETKTLHYLAYKKIITRSLPHPFATNCYDYGNDGYISSSHCIAMCKLKHWKQVLGDKWPGYYNTDNQTSDQYIVDIYDLSKYGINYLKRNIIDKQIGFKCAEECKSMTSCNEESYHVRSMQYDNIYDELWLLILPPYNPDQIIVYSPKLTLEEFVCLTGSLISLYFGFSIIMLSNMTSVVFKYCVNKVTNNLVNFFAVNNNNTNIQFLLFERIKLQLNPFTRSVIRRTALNRVNPEQISSLRPQRLYSSKPTHSEILRHNTNRPTCSQTNQSLNHQKM